MRTPLCVWLILIFFESRIDANPKAVKKSSDDKEVLDILKTEENEDYEGDDELSGGKDLEKVNMPVKSVSEVKNIADIEQLDKILEILPIDDDLAIKMKNQVPEKRENGADFNSGSGLGADIEAKLQRLYELFGIDDLDDIIKVIPINSVEKLTGIKDVTHLKKPLRQVDMSNARGSRLLRNRYGGRRPSDPIITKTKYASIDSPETYNPLLGRADKDERRTRHPKHRRKFIETQENPIENYDIYRTTGGQPNYDDIEYPDYDTSDQQELDAINRKIQAVDGEISRKVNDMMKQKAYLAKEDRFKDVLDQMIARERKKLNAIIKVRRDHESKAASVAEGIDDLRNILREYNNKKGQYLDTLKTMADMEKQRDEKRLNRLGNGYMPLLDEYSYTDNEAEYGLGGEDIQLEKVEDIDEIESAVKINKLQRINSITELTDEQAQQLKSWQDERNNIQDHQYSN